ncbi:4052_t:CDS:2 [Funneliformis geosporum]|uniref:8051_t:CDS:1 n=1 Tax=Funneliformis geosporum TaxID=1117311 RepID=A0A9W4T0F3_9GLOM|nr:4052_t:CDS:2 [Funneliformis geosporum]CAI2188009.1 8051_t:CDS:2 [Funneliformis geosporum]
MSSNKNPISRNDQSEFQELRTLRTLRASLTSVDIFTKQVLQDLEIMTRNYETISAICEGWKVELEKEPFDSDNIKCNGDAFTN